MSTLNAAAFDSAFQNHIEDICANMSRLAQEEVKVPGLRGLSDKHYVIITKYNDFVACLGNRALLDECVVRFKDMIVYINMHFLFEDSLMRMFAYPGYERHRKQHLEFIKQLDSYLKKIIAQTETLEGVAMYIGHWLIGHILISDMEFEDYEASLPDLAEMPSGTA